MVKNAIILTAGLSGSSVLAGLISRAGYWTGRDTFKKEYDTHENVELVELNQNILHESGYQGSYTWEFSSEAIQQVLSSFDRVERVPYERFLEKCNNNRPWIWKDPRLWLTIRFWRNLLDLEHIGFILLTRNQLQGWVSAMLRRRIRTFASYKKYDDAVNQSMIQFMEKSRQPYLHVQYEDLILRPQEAILALNKFLHTELTVEDIERVYNLPLYRNPKSKLDLLKAIAIYIKNYPGLTKG